MADGAKEKQDKKFGRPITQHDNGDDFLLYFVLNNKKIKMAKWEGKLEHSHSHSRYA